MSETKYTPNPEGFWPVEEITAEEFRARYTQPKADDRCAVCGWPLALTAHLGCRRGNCSMRPLPMNLYDRARAEAEYGVTFPGQPLPIQFREQP